jgi:energy-coupling factor transport system substrate-specific component
MQRGARFTMNGHILRRYPLRAWGAVVLLGLFNAGFGVMNHHTLQTPLFFDTIGTVAAAAAFGILPGVVTAVCTHVFIVVLDGFVALKLLWTLVSISSAVIIGIMAQRGAFTTPVHIITAIVLITFVSSILSAAIAAFAFTGLTDHPVDYLVSSFMAIGRNIISASFWARLPINVIDKGIAVLIAFLARKLWFDRWQAAEGREFARQRKEQV